MITIIFGMPGTGKTSLMTHLLNTYAFDNTRATLMRRELLLKRTSGFTNISTFPLHSVSANYTCTFRKFRYKPRHNRVINPYRLGFSNKFVRTHFNLPYEVVGVTEAQKYLNSRMSMYFPDWQSRWYEAHRHNNLEIFLDTQRPMLIDVNIRELSQFIEIQNLDIHYSSYGQIIGMTWHVRKFATSKEFDKYTSSSNQDNTNLYEEFDITADYNVFDCYNSQSCKPKFYDGHFKEDIDYQEAIEFTEDISSYIEYLKNNDDELPPNFYQKRSIN